MPRKRVARGSALRVEGKPVDIVRALAPEIAATMFIMRTMAEMGADDHPMFSLSTMVASTSLESLIAEAYVDESDAVVNAVQRKAAAILRKRLAPFITEEKAIEDEAEVEALLANQSVVVERGIKLAREMMKLRLADPDVVA